MNDQTNVLDRHTLDQRTAEQNARNQAGNQADPRYPADQTSADKAAAKAAADKAAQPKTANEVLARVDEDHNWTHDPIDMNSTGGIQKATERNWRAIQALANFVDGKPQKGY